MDYSVGGARAARLLLDYLQDEFNYRNPSPILWNRLQESFGDRVYSEILHFLTQMQFEPEEARDHWQAITGHRESLKHSLGRDPGLRVALADYFVNIRPRVNNPILVEISLFLKKEESALKDELTGLYNRRFFNETLKQELDRARRFSESVSLLMIDVDHFKSYNDCYGHPAGDRALVEVARALEDSSRSIDHLTRYGGEEFALILPRSDRSEALCAGERHRLAVAGRRLDGRPGRRLTISIGAASFPEDVSGTAADLVEAADQALYEAKRSGRNRVFSTHLNQRRHRRYPVELEAAFKVEAQSVEHSPAWIKNLSQGGLLAAINREMKQGEGLEVQLSRPDRAEGLRVRGRCVRVLKDARENGLFFIGVQFELEKPEEAKAVTDLIETQTLRPKL